MGRIHSKGGLFFITIFFVSFDSSKTKNIPEGKTEINGKMLEILKYQDPTHPEIVKWQNVLRERRKDRGKKNNITTKDHIGTYEYEKGREEINTHTPSLTEKSGVKRLPILATLIPHITKFIGELIHKPRPRPQTKTKAFDDQVQTPQGKQTQEGQL